MYRACKRIPLKSRSCCIPQCVSHCVDGVSLHNFPLDPKLRKIWADILKIEKPINRFMYVCSKHFSKRDFFPKVNEHQNTRNRLKGGAVPSLNLPKAVSAKLKKNEEIRDLGQIRNRVKRKTIIKESQKIEESKNKEVNNEVLPNIFCGYNEVDTLIKKEHAYAYSEETNLIKDECLEEDPLKIHPEDVVIKTEIDDIEIKNEPVDTCDLNSVDNGIALPIEYMEPNKFVTANVVLQESEIVPESKFLELQQKYKVVSELLKIRDDKKIVFENTRLKMQIVKLKESNEKNNTRLTNKIRKLHHDIKEQAREAAISRSYASKLAIEKEQLKHKLSQHTNCKLLENTVANLKERLHKFIDFQNTAAANLQVLESQLTLTENENINLRKALDITQNEKEKEKKQIQELLHIQIENAKLIKNCSYMKQKMDEIVNMKESLEKNIDSFAEEMNKIVTEKNIEIENEKDQVANLSKQVSESQRTIEALKEKYKNLIRYRDMCVKEKTIAITKSEQVVSMLKDMIQEQSDEVLHCKEENKSLQEQIETLRMKPCDYCGL